MTSKNDSKLMASLDAAPTFENTLMEYPQEMDRVQFLSHLKWRLFLDNCSFRRHVINRARQHLLNVTDSLLRKRYGIRLQHLCQFHESLFSTIHVREHRLQLIHMMQGSKDVWKVGLHQACHGPISIALMKSSLKDRVNLQ